MNTPATIENLLASDAPVLALAPMQDVTDLNFLKLMTAYGGADLYCTEYFRVHKDSHLDKWILRSITENPTGRPIVAQMIGNDVPSLVRTARELQQYPIAAVDLNLGCPAPIVYRKCAGGGLLREFGRLHSILGALRDAVSMKFTIKTRIGFDSWDDFEELLAIFAKYSVDLVTVHGRTVAERYRSAVHYDVIAKAVATLSCPVIANGNIFSPGKAADVLAQTNARGLMIGRAAIRNPWIFQQIRQHRAGLPIHFPSGREVLEYVRALYAATYLPHVTELQQVQNMKKYLGFIGLGVEPTGRFLHEMRRAMSEAEMFAIFDDHLSHDDAMPLEPFALTFEKPGDVLAGEHA